MASNGWTDRLTSAMRVFNGVYDGTKLAEIRRFGGSDIYARLIATKCRGATSLLRDVYLNIEKPWALQPTPDPTLPDDIIDDVQNLIQVEVSTMQRLGEPPDPAADPRSHHQPDGCRQARRDQTGQDGGRGGLCQARRHPGRGAVLRGAGAISWSTCRCSRSPA